MVLSACQSGVGMTVDGQLGTEYTGLPYPFLASGASAIVGSLWTVDDTATSALMMRVSSSLMEDGGRRSRMETRSAEKSKIEFGI